MPKFKIKLGLKPFLVPLVDSRVQSVTDPTPRFSNVNRVVAPLSVHWITTVALPIASEEGAVVSIEFKMRHKAKKKMLYVNNVSFSTLS